MNMSDLDCFSAKPLELCLLAECLETKEKECLGVWGSHISHFWVPPRLEMNCIFFYD